MKKQAFRIFTTLSLVGLLAVASVYGQSVGSIRANIPFNFVVKDTTLPAGEYTVEPIREAQLLIRSADSRACAMVFTIPLLLLWSFIP